jgi:LysM repeat protein
MSLYSAYTKANRANGCLKAVSLAIISLVLASCGAGKTIVAGGKTSTLQDDIIQYGKQYLGKPYRYAGKGPNSFDCSGYTSFVFRKFGYRLDHSSMGQDRQIPTIARKKDLRKGDLVFFEGRIKSGRIEHVGIVTETFSNGHFKFIHSSTSRGVTISSSTEPYFASRYLRGGRVLEENASYVTRRNPPANRKQPAFYSPAHKEPTQQITPREITEPAVVAGQTEERSENGNEPVVIVQTDPLKNPPLEHSHSTTNGDEQGKDTLRQKKSEMVMKEEENAAIPLPPKSHTVQMGETLYSISRRYGCSVEQLKEWNPQMGAVLKAGEKLHLFP